jgi:hypothetical protein
MELLDSHAQMLMAIADRIIPADDAPGGASTEFMTLVADVLGNELPEHIDPIRRWLDTLNVAAKVRWQRRFVDLDAEQQDDLLREHETDAAFGVVVDLVHENYWASDAGRAAVGFEVRG